MFLLFFTLANALWGEGVEAKSQNGAEEIVFHFQSMLLILHLCFRE
jgi:hypothetical protein